MEFALNFDIQRKEDERSVFLSLLSHIFAHRFENFANEI